MLYRPTALFSVKEKASKGSKVKVDKKCDILWFLNRHSTVFGQLARVNSGWKNSLWYEMVKTVVHKVTDGEREDRVWGGGVDSEWDWGEELSVRKEGCVEEERKQWWGLTQQSKTGGAERTSDPETVVLYGLISSDEVIKILCNIDSCIFSFINIINWID